MDGISEETSVKKKKIDRLNKIQNTRFPREIHCYVLQFDTLQGNGDKLPKGN